jgi:hypothetical protein
MSLRANVTKPCEYFSMNRSKIFKFLHRANLTFFLIRSMLLQCLLFLCNPEKYSKILCNFTQHLCIFAIHFVQFSFGASSGQASLYLLDAFSINSKHFVLGNDIEYFILSGKLKTVTAIKLFTVVNNTPGAVCTTICFIHNYRIGPIS